MDGRELNTIGRRDAKTHAVQLFPVPIDGALNQLTLGPDGNMWFTDQGEYYNPQPFQSHIGRILTHAPYTITEFNTPTAESRALRLTVGSDHNIWFTEYYSTPSGQTTPRGGNAIGRISPFGSDTQIQASIKEFPLSTPKAGPSGITAGRDGNLWFAEVFTNQIGRITTQGTITEYPLPPGGSPNGITGGPDGNLWFTDRGVNSIGRMLIRDPHTVNLFPVPGNPVLNWITTGPDDNMWFTDYLGNIGQVLTHSPNTVTVHHDPLPNALEGDIKCGPDGAIWFGEIAPPSGTGTHDLGQAHLTDNPFTTAVYSARCRVDNLLSSFGIG